MELFTPGGVPAQREPTPQEREDYLAAQMEGELRAFTFQTFQQMIAVRLIKRGDYDEKPLADIARETLSDATEVTLASVEAFSGRVFQKAARKLAQELVKQGHQ